MCDREERDPQSSLRLRHGSRFGNRKVRKRPADRRSSPSGNVYEGNLTSVEVESDQRKSIRTARYDLPDISAFEQKQNDYCRWKSYPILMTEGKQEFSTRRSTMAPEMTEDDVYASHIRDDESEIRDKYAGLDEDDFETGIVENNYGATTKARDTARKRQGNAKHHLPSRLGTLKHRISRLNQFFNSRKEAQNSMKRKPCSFEVFIVMFSFRFMSRNQFCLDRDCDGPLIPNNYIKMEVAKTLIYRIIKWMYENKFIPTQEENYQLPIHSYNDSNDTSSVQSSLSHYSDSCASSTDSSLLLNENCLDLSDYIAPEYFQIFLKSLDETTDLTSDYINAHNRTQLDDIENDDDGMSEELNNLRFVIEIEIEKELIEIDAQHSAEFSTDKLREKIPIDLEYMDSATATDAFYNAVAAMSSESSSPSPSVASTETTFDVQNAREAVLKLVNQIQSQLPQKNHDKTPQDLPQVQQKIMNDLLILSQAPDPLTDYEISIDLQSSVSSIGLDDDPTDGYCAQIALETSDSIGSFTSEKIDPALKQSSEDSDVAIEVDRGEDHKAFCRPQETDQGMLSASNIPERTRKTIWNTLLDRRQKSKSDRRSPYLQFRKERSRENSSIGTENSLDDEYKYFSQEYIRESHGNNENIEVILKDTFEISRMEDSLATNCPEESNTIVSKEKSNVSCTNTVPSTKTEMVSQYVKTTDFGEKERISRMNRMKSTIRDIHYMHDESFKTGNDYLDIVWSLSPTIDPFRSTSDTTSSLTGAESTKAESVQNKSVNTQSISPDADSDSKSILSVINDKVLQLVRNSDKVEKENTRIQMECPQKKKEDSTNPASPKLFEYWETLLTHSFSSTFEKNIENEPIYVVQSTGTEFNSEPIMNHVDISKRAQCEPILKDDPSGIYSLGYYSDDANLDSNSCKEYGSACSIGEISQDTKGTDANSEFDYSIDDHSLEYDPFEAARKIPEIFSKTDFSLESLEEPRRNEYYLCSGGATANSYEQPIVLDVSDYSAETLYFDTEDIKLCVSVTSSLEAIEVSDSLPTMYYTLPIADYSYTLPSVDYSDE